MIQANELRVGNLVDWNSEIAKISQLLELEAVFKCGEMDLYTALNPIELTEEILLRSGSNKQSDNTFDFDRFRLVWLPGYKYWYVTEKFEGVYLTKIEFVHEWQNFVFVMNGKELDIKL